MTIVVLLPSLNSDVNAIILNNTDFYLEANVNLYDIGKKLLSEPYEPMLNITKFEIKGSSESYKQICPSLQCKIDYKDKFATFSPPDIPQSNLIISSFDFTLHDDITHDDLGPKKKELIEEYTAQIFCNVYDIVEKNEQELYYCHNANLNSIISSKFDDRSWVFDNTGIYDAKNDILKISGNFTGP
jgi:hypothetical protein